jgi:hypothetical protein
MPTDGTPVSSPVVSAYVTLDDANTYFATRLNSDAWDGASDVDKQKALYQATRAIDNLRFTGVKSDYYNHTVLGQSFVEQQLEFPRNGLTEVPEGIKNACCECAVAFLDGIDIDQELRRQRVQSQGFASVRQAYFDKQAPNPWVLAGIPTYTAWQFLLPYLADPREISRIRTS